MKAVHRVATLAVLAAFALFVVAIMAVGLDIAGAIPDAGVVAEPCLGWGTFIASPGIVALAILYALGYDPQ